MEKERHPKGLYVLFFTEMWERFGFYSMLAMFTLYLKDDKSGFGWTAAEATRLYSIYLTCVYASPLVGGWIADKKLGYRNSILIGGLIFMVGYWLLAIHTIAAVYTALACLVVANAFFKPNVSAMVGHLYPEGSSLKDRAYNIFYMGINIGALLAPINAEIMKQAFGFNVAFSVAGFGMIAAVLILWSFRHLVAGADTGGSTPDPSATGAPPVAPPRLNPMDAVPESKRILALIVIFSIVIVFWMVFSQNGSTLTYWADDNTDWKVTGIISNAINPFWVVTLTFPLVWVWRWLASKNREPSTPAKMTGGMFLCAASFGLLHIAARTGESKEATPDLYPTGSFRVTPRALDFLKGDGVPEEVLTRLRDAKDEDKKNIVLGKKFSPDGIFEDALETIKQDLHSRGVPKEAWPVLKAAEFPRDVKDMPIEESDKFAAALKDLVRALQEKGLPDDVAGRVLAYKGKRFTGEEKLTDAAVRVLGRDAAEKYRPAILKRAYLFKVSPLWLIFAYMVMTLAELMLSPMGLSLVSKVAPARLRGVMMGGWFVATAVGNALTMIGVYWERWLQSTFFAVLGGMALVMAFVLLTLLRPLKKAMPGA